MDALSSKSLENNMLWIYITIESELWVIFTNWATEGHCPKYIPPTLH